MFVITSVIVISGMGMAKKLAFKDTPTPVSTGVLQELQTSESVFPVFFNFNNLLDFDKICRISSTSEASRTRLLASRRPPHALV